VFQILKGDKMSFIRLRQNTLQRTVAIAALARRRLAAGMNGMATRRSSKSKGGLASANSALIPHSLLWGASFFNELSSFIFLTFEAFRPCRFYRICCVAWRSRQLTTGVHPAPCSSGKLSNRSTQVKLNDSNKMSIK